MKIPPFRKWVLLAMGATLLQFSIFKIFYPYASFFQDSYTYIDDASQGVLISYRPAGYSWFLSLVHLVSSSDSVLVFTHYFLLQMAALYLFLTIERLYGPPRTARNILFVFLLINPLSLYLANMVSSDALFTSLSLVWLTGLLRLMHRPSWIQLTGAVLLLVVIFFVRYNALCYPIIAAAAFLLCRKSILFTIAGIVSSIGMLVLAAAVIMQVTKLQEGVRVFSAFSGWQMANNALYVYPYVKTEPERLPSQECRELDSIVKAHFDTAGFSKPGGQPIETWYMWDAGSPLKKYMRLRQQREKTDYFAAWNRVGPVFSQYGFYLIRHHPGQFCLQYGWPSARMYFYPPLDVLAGYNLGAKEVDTVAMDWFHFKSNAVRVRSYTVQSIILGWVPGAFLLINVAFALAACLLLSKYKRGELRWAMQLTGVYFVINAAFSIFSTPNVMRYQVAPFYWIFVFTLLAFLRLFSQWTPEPAIRKE